MERTTAALQVDSVKQEPNPKRDAWQFIAVGMSPLVVVDFTVCKGGVAQGLEHSVHTRGVIGSNPITATKDYYNTIKERIRYG